MTFLKKCGNQNAVPPLICQTCYVATNFNNKNYNFSFFLKKTDCIFFNIMLKNWPLYAVKFLLEQDSLQNSVMEIGLETLGLIKFVWLVT